MPQWPCRRPFSPATTPRERPAYDLTTELRPALLRIGERMARLLVQVAEDGPAPDALAARVEAALARHALPPARVQAIARSLEALGQPAP